MKPFIQSLGMSIIVLFLSSASFSKPLSEPEGVLTSTFSKRCIETFEGSINETLGIVMQIQRLDDQLFGTYYYISQYIKYREKLWVTGYVTPDGDVVLEEHLSPYHRERNGIFEGRFVTESSIEGIWSNSDRSKSYPFVLEKKLTRIHDATISGNLTFHVLRQPMESGDMLYVHIPEEKDMIPLGSQCNRFHYPDDWESLENIIMVEKLGGTPTLYHIEWTVKWDWWVDVFQHCYYIVSEKKPYAPVLKDCLEQPKGQRLTIKEHKVQYGYNSLYIKDRYQIGEQTWRWKTLEKSYHVTEDGMLEDVDIDAPSWKSPLNPNR